MPVSTQHIHAPARASAIDAMNQGDRLSQSQDREELEAAVAAYSRSIDILIPISDLPKNANALSAAYSNRGHLISRLHGRSQIAAIQKDFESAAAILEPLLTEPEIWIRRNYAGALINLANLRLDQLDVEPSQEIARKALAAIRFVDSRDPVDAQIEALALRSLCDTIGQRLPSLAPDEQMAAAIKASDYADEGLALIRSFRRPAMPEPFPELSERLYRFGARLYALHQPRHLEEFLSEHLETLPEYKISDFYPIATEAIGLAVESLSNPDCEASPDPVKSDQQRAIAESLFQLHQRLSLYFTQL